MDDHLNELNIGICGVGGQGNILLEKIIGLSAIREGYFVAAADTFGAAQRGGSVLSHIRIGTDIASSLIPERKCQVLIGLEPGETLRTAGVYLDDNGLIIVNTEPVLPAKVKTGEWTYPSIKDILVLLKQITPKIVEVNGATLAVKAAGSEKALNMVMAGVFAGLGVGPFRTETIEEAIRDTSGKNVEKNIKAFRSGFRIGQSRAAGEHGVSGAAVLEAAGLSIGNPVSPSSPGKPRPSSFNHDTGDQADFLLGNEAMARGALEAGVRFVAGYPGTPSSEILETLAQDADKHGLYVEWSTNEMVAFENALGASLAGLRALITMKHAGLNWVVDPLSVAVLSGIVGGLVILTADDPNCHSSANEQDNRFYGLFLKVLTLEPSDAQTAKEMMKQAFYLSERTELPVILRSVTRVAHSRTGVSLGRLPEEKSEASGGRNPERFFITGARALKGHVWQLKQQTILEQAAEESPFNELQEKGDEELCIIAAGVAYTYVKDALRLWRDVGASLLKIGCVHPVPRSLIGSALSGKKAVLVVEEGGPFVELQVRALLPDLSSNIKVLGKMSGDVPEAGELNVDVVTGSIARFLGRIEPRPGSRKEILKRTREILPPRTMVFCAGCPHSGTMYALKKTIRKAKVKPFVAGDIGCYTLMCYPPHELGDAKFSMGSSISVAAGHSKGTGEKAVAVIGDSTFLHAGIPGLINCVYNQSNVLVVICDNGTTGMTGGQPHAGTGITVTGRKTKKVVLENLIRGCGVDFIEVTDPYEVKATRKVLEKAFRRQGLSVVIARRECALLAARKASRSDNKTTARRVDLEKCVGCWECVKGLACPAMIREKDGVVIESSGCTGCGLCAQVCPKGAIN
ncbi:MAG: indolepyruvate ferredoxin oxidoreductase subunit alpha [Thermodesulfobacteriota bacterium]